MSTLSAILNTAGRAISTYQSAISVTGQNISNADNEDYSRQTVDYQATGTVKDRGVTYGTGVQVNSVIRQVNQTLENMMTSEVSTKSALAKESVYMTSIENLFKEDTDDSLNTLMDNYWSAWEALANNPDGPTEQNGVYKAGINLAKGFSNLSQELGTMVSGVNQELSTSVTNVGSIASQIANLNLAITQAESSGGNANDLNDKRNGLIDDLGELIDIDITIKEDGTYFITTSGGLPLVEDGISYSLENSGDRVLWRSNSGATHDITDDISGGTIAGCLEIRDSVIPETQAGLDELASNMIWLFNYQHSQGAGQSYYSSPVEGTYSTDKSKTLASLAYGDKINYAKDFGLIIKDSSGTSETYQKSAIDMGISQSKMSDISGKGAKNSTYVFTVVDEGTLGEQTVVQSSGTLMGSISSGNVISDSLDSALAKQILTITGGENTQKLSINDSGSGAGRSAAQIAKELNSMDGINAYASSTQAQFGVNGVTQAQDGDTVQFSLYVDGVEKKVNFTVDSSKGSFESQFKSALEDTANEINKTNQNTDLMVNGTTIESAAGATIGIQEFEVVDNSGVTLGNFSNFNKGDTVSLTLATDATPSDTITINVDLTDVDTSDSNAVAKAFNNALKDKLDNSNYPFSAQFDDSTGELTVRTTDGTGLSLSSATGDTGNNATISVTTLSGSTTGTGDGTLTFNGTDTESVTANTANTDYVSFSLAGCENSTVSSAATSVGESGGSYDTAAVVTGSVTIVMDPGMKITSDNSTSAGLFGTTGNTSEGNSLITLGGTDGYENFNDGDTISFELDGHTVSYNVASVSGQLTDAEQADQLYSALNSSLPSDEYEVIRNGNSVSIVRTSESDDAISITNFSDSTTGDAELKVSTGTGTGVDEPDNSSLISGDTLHDSSSAATFGDPATIYYEVLDDNGDSTGTSGYAEVDEPGLVEIKENGKTTLSFELSQGSLVAGNTLRVNTDSQGKADPLNVRVDGKANSIDDTYEFKVISGGTLPDNNEDIVIEWKSGSSSGTMTLEGNDSSQAPINLEIDGMQFSFESGTVVKGDVFYVKTNETGQVVSSTSGESSNTVETLSDWHWTIDSFAEEFNRNSGGLTASVTQDNTLLIDSNSDYCAMEDVTYSDSDGITEDNVSITVKDYSALTVAAENLTFSRSNGTWNIGNDPTGGKMQLIPEGGDDDGFLVDIDGDGLGDIEIKFDNTVTGDGEITMDLAQRDDADFSFAFTGQEDGDSGVAAALGLNTFFTGSDAASMGVNELMADTDHLASGTVNTETGELKTGENNNALSMSDTRNTNVKMKKWNYTRGEAPTSSVSTTTVDSYEDSFIASIGLTSASISSSKNYADTLTYQVTKQRNSVSAVSLDEEMIKLTAQQQAYSAAAQLLSTVDEMFDALMATR
jgi:flagellar hook-associated protein 1 FlgK